MIVPKEASLGVKIFGIVLALIWTFVMLVPAVVLGAAIGAFAVGNSAAEHISKLLARPGQK